jgi:SAM-dependent methyltransferase
VVGPGRYHCFDQIAEVYDETRKSRKDILDKAVDLVIEKVGLSKDDRILDLGCGTGRISVEFALRDFDIVGLDVSGRMLSLAARKCESCLGRVRLVQGDAQRLPFAAEAFDAVLAVHVFHLMEGWRSAFRQAMESLRPGGSMILWGSGRGRILQPVREKYRELAAEAGYADLRLGARDFDEVAGFAREEGLSVSRIDAGDLYWEFESSPESGIDLLRRKWVTDTWIVPDEDHASIIEKLTETLAGQLGDLKSPTRFTNSMLIYGIRSP